MRVKRSTPRSRQTARTFRFIGGWVKEKSACFGHFCAVIASLKYKLACYRQASAVLFSHDFGANALPYPPSRDAADIEQKPRNRFCPKNLQEPAWRSYLLAEDYLPHFVGDACTRNRHRHVHTIETRTAHTAARHLTVERHVCVMTDQDQSFDWRLTKGIRRCLALFVDIAP